MFVLINTGNGITQ